jgi:hypothetical protein
MAAAGYGDFAMRRLFIILFILSLGATVTTIYWRTYMPEGPAAASAPQSRTRSLGQDPSRPPSSAPSSEQLASDRQDLAVTISIVSSIISAIAALMQTWLTARALPGKRD